MTTRLALAMLALLCLPARAEPPAPATPFRAVAATTWLGGTLTTPLADAVSELEARGITTVIDLREPGDADLGAEAAVLQASGIRYVNFPVGRTAPGAERLAAFARLMDETAADRRLVHCVSGNRAGMIWALDRLRAGAPLAAVLAEIDGLVTHVPLLDIVKTYAATPAARADSSL